MLSRFLSSFFLLFCACDLVSSASSDNFDWSEVRASADYQWQPCYDVFECTRLQVPLDYSHPEDTQAGIAILRHRTNSSNGVPLFYNPGGPGLSGVTGIINTLESLRQRAGLEYDLIGFDTRGVAASTPSASIFNNQCERNLFYDQNFPPVPGENNETLVTRWATSTMFGNLVIAKDFQSGDTNHHLRHMTTEATARDMLYMAEKYGREKVSFLGVSYGSLLGQTFATLFPDKVERMVLDGMVNAERYYSGLGNLETTDSDKAMKIFFQECFKAGPEKCAFWSSTPEAIEAELEGLYKKLRTSPMVSTLSLVTYSTVRDKILGDLYNPMGWKTLAQGLADLSRRDNGSIISTPVRTNIPVNCLDPQFEYMRSLDQATVVYCNDARNVNYGLEELQANFEKLNGTIPFIDVSIASHINCIGYPDWPKNHFQGPVGANTSNPILIVSATEDPVTPLSNADKVATLFPGSGILKMDGPGHSSFSFSADNCTAKVYQEYLIQGKLPDGGTVCSPDKSLIFGGSS